MIRALAAALVLASCASAPAPVPINIARTNPPIADRDLDLPANADVLMLAFSGGGARAASFSYGVLLGLKGMPGAPNGTPGATRLDDVALVTAVSGGAITAAYLGQHGAAGIEGLAGFLDEDWAGDLNTSALAPQNWMRAARGGLNSTTALADRLDGALYRGAAFADLTGRPRVILNAADLYTGAPIAFTHFYFDALCSDLGAVRLADAVAASMAVPLAFQPVLAAPFGDCAAPEWAARALADRSAPSTLRATARAFALYHAEPRRYLHLVDGGVADNFGLATFSVMRAAARDAYAPLSARDAARLARLTVIVVNAELALTGDEWSRSPRGPSGAAAMGTALSGSIDAGKRGAYDAFLAMTQLWERDLIAWRCARSAAEIAALRGGADGWRCDDLDIRVEMIAFDDLGADRAAELGAAPTRVSLPRETIAALIQGGRDAIALSSAAAR